MTEPARLARTGSKHAIARHEGSASSMPSVRHSSDSSPPQSGTASLDISASNTYDTIEPFYRDPEEEKREERRRTRLPKLEVNKKIKEIQKIHASSLNPLTATNMQEHIPDYAKEFPHHATAWNLLKSNRVCISIYICIVLSSVAMGVQLQNQDESNKNTFFTIDCFFLMVFVGEVCLKVYTFGHKYFWFYSFQMEFLCTCAAMIDLGLRYQGLEETWKNTSNACRCSRILLLSKLFMMIGEFRVLILSFRRSVLSLWGIVFIVLVVCYGSTIVCYSVVGKSREYKDNATMRDDHEKYFGSVTRTMLTLFSMAVVSDWDHIVRFVYQKQPVFCIFFIFFTIFMTLGIMNVIVGIVVDQVFAVHKDAVRYDDEKERTKYGRQLQQIVDVYLETSSERDKLITEKCMTEIAEIIEIVGGIDLPSSYSYVDLFTLLDSTGTGKINQDMFVNGILNLMFSSDGQREIQTQLTVNSIRKDIYLMRKEIHGIYYRTKAIDEKPGFSFANGAGFPFIPPPPTGHHHPPMGKTDSMVDHGHHDSRHDRFDRHGPTHRDRDRDRDPPPRAPKKDFQFQNPWQELRAALQTAATKVCKAKLRECWEKLDENLDKMDVANKPKGGIMPSMTASGADFADQEEVFFVWNKLCSAVFRESLPDLRRALHHAKGIHVKEEDLATILTYRDALARRESKVEPQQVVDAFERNDFSHALELVIDSSLARGADRNLLLNALVRLNSGPGFTPQQAPAQVMQPTSNQSNGNGETANRGKGVSNTKPDVQQVKRGQALRAVTSPGEVPPIEAEVKHLLSVLHAEASQQAKKEVNKAWEQVDKAYRANPDAKGAFGPDYTPFAQLEEMFFIRNQINNAVAQSSLPGLRRSISHAIAFGIEATTMEIEIAYRDALARQQQSNSTDLDDIKTALDSGDWWSVLEVVVDACLTTGTDRYFLSELLTKVCATVAI